MSRSATPSRPAGWLARSVILALAPLMAVPFDPAAAQDVELLGRIYGTRPPAAYYEELARDMGAFQFRQGVWRNRMLELSAGAGGEARAGEAAIFGQRDGAVEGTFRMPLIMGLFSDSPQDPPFSRPRVQAEFFDGPNSRYRTITDFYREISGGRVELLGETFPWRRAELTQAEVAGGRSGLSSNAARVGEYIVQILAQIDDGSVDWGRYDNDGPDGIPNSGDDDGFVDVLAVMHPTHGAECGEGRESDYIWSHRWTISAWVGGPYVTRSPSANGGQIRIADYTIQPVRSCDQVSINQIGVFAHELGHGFGLPDLYDTNSNDGSHGAAGNWALMGTGSWGCGEFDPARPCHMSAWSKSVLGWVGVERLEPGLDHGVVSLEPVEAGGRVLRIPAGDGSGEYFLLENRQRIGFDSDLFAPGLLVWQIDPQVVEGGGGVNSDRDHMGVWLRQADGLDDLGRNGGGRGDAGDPFPGSTGNDAFHAGSTPGSWSHGGTAMGVTLLDIGQTSSTMELRALTRFQELVLRAEGVPDTAKVFSVDGASLEGSALSVASAPFQEHTLAAASGVALSQGVRTGFVEWRDSSGRIRSFQTALGDSTLVASYGGREVLLNLALESPVAGIEPGGLTLTPEGDEGWFPEGTEVQVRAEPRTGFAFREWTGDLRGLDNPATVILEAPRTGGASFDLTFGVEEVVGPVVLEAAVESEVVLQVENANLPVAWAVTGGELPVGLSFEPEGVFRGVPMESGTFTVAVRVSDQIGLEASAGLTLEVMEPTAGIDVLAAPFLLLSGGPGARLEQFLDLHGNENGSYDLGDLRAHLQRNPELPMTGELAQTLTRVVVPLTPPWKEEQQ